MEGSRAVCLVNSASPLWARGAHLRARPDFSLNSQRRLIVYEPRCNPTPLACFFRQLLWCGLNYFVAESNLMVLLTCMEVQPPTLKPKRTPPSPESCRTWHPCFIRHFMFTFKNCDRWKAAIMRHPSLKARLDTTIQPGQGTLLALPKLLAINLRLTSSEDSTSRSQPIQTHHTSYHLCEMPLVVPGITGGSDKNDWMTKLMGKKLTDSTSDHSSFSKKELPANHRVVEGDSMMTMDHNPDRLVSLRSRRGPVR